MTNEERVEELSTFIWGLRKGQKNEFKNEMFYEFSEHAEECSTVEEFMEEIESKDLLWFYLNDSDFINEMLQEYSSSINKILINEYMKTNGINQLTEIDGFNEKDIIVQSEHNKRLIMSKVLEIVINELEMKLKGEN